MNEKHTFYEECGRILGIDHESSNLDKPNFSLRTAQWELTSRNRWNNRRPGNGRYAGFGLIRIIRGELVHITLHHPVMVNRLFKTQAEALDFLREIMK